MIYPARILKLRVRGTKKDIAQDISNEEVCFVMDRVIARFDGSDLQVIDFNVVTILKFAEVCFLFDLSNVQILYCSCLEEPSFFSFSYFFLHFKFPLEHVVFSDNPCYILQFAFLTESMTSFLLDG